MKNKFVFFFFIIFANISLVTAQSIQSCSTIVQDALTQMGTNCANLDSNSACYGHLGVSAEFVEDATVTFVAPADRAAITELETLTTAPLDEQTGVWGISVLRLTANIPNSLPGQGVVFIMVGEATLTNEVAEENAYVPDTTVSIEIATDDATLLSYPPAWGNHQSLEVGTLASGATVDADALSTDGQWLRVIFESDITDTSKRATAWVNINDIANADLTGLSVINSDSRTPMQLFSLETGLGQPICREQPPSQLIIQGPETVEVELNANGLDFRVSSTVSLQVNRNPDGTLVASFTPVTGSVIIPDPNDPDNLENAINVTASQFINIPFTIDETTGKIVVDPEWIEQFDDVKEEFDVATEEGTNYIGSAIVDLLGTLQALPENLLNYSLDENTPVIIRPSGVGNPIPEFSTFDPSGG